MKPINCIYFFVPKHNAKTVYRWGYCPKMKEICTLLEKHGVCLIQKERDAKKSF